jgi:hypothetical protein
MPILSLGTPKTATQSDACRCAKSFGKTAKTNGGNCFGFCRRNRANSQLIKVFAARFYFFQKFYAK